MGAQIIYIPQPTDNTAPAPIAASAPAPVAAPPQGGVGLMGLLGAGTGGAALAKYGNKLPKLFGRGAPTPVTPAPAPVASPSAPAAASPQPASPSEPPVDLTTALDPKAAPMPPKTGFAGGQPTDVGAAQHFGKRTGGVPLKLGAPTTPTFNFQPVEKPGGPISTTGSSGTLLDGPPAPLQITGPARKIPITGPAQPAGLLPSPPKSGFGAVTGNDMADIIAARAPASNALNAAAFSTQQTEVRQAAQDAAQGAAMEGEGGGSALSRFLGGEAGSVTLKGAGKLATGAGGLATLLNAVHQNAVIPALTGDPNAGAKAVANAGPLTNLIEPAAMHASAQAAHSGLPLAAQGLIGLLGGGASVAARAADATDIPSLVGGLGRYLGHGLGLDSAAPAAPAAMPSPSDGKPVTMQRNTDGTHTVTVNGVAHHPATHNVEDFVNNARASGLTLNDLGKMYALHQHFSPQQNAATAALSMAEQAHNQNRMSDADFMKTLERWGLQGGAALFPDAGAQ